MAIYDEVRQKLKDVHVMAPDVQRKGRERHVSRWADNWTGFYQNVCLQSSKCTTMLRDFYAERCEVIHLIKTVWISERKGK